MTDRLRKSCRVYRSMLARMPMDQRAPEYRAALDYIQKAVRGARPSKRPARVGGVEDVNHWQMRGHRWALKKRDSGLLVGSKEGGPVLVRTRKQARSIAAFNKLSDVEIVKIRVSYEQIK